MISRLFASLKSFFYIQTEEQYKKELIIKINTTNVANIIIISKTFVVLEILMIAFSIINKGSALFVQPKIIFLAMYVLLALAAFLNYLVFAKLQKNIPENGGGIMTAGIIFTTFILSWCAGISLLDQLSYGQIIVYIAAIISIGVVPFFQPFILFSMYFLVQSAFILLLPFFLPSDGSIFGNIANSSLIMILALTISHMRYKNCVKVFENEKSIKEKSQQLAAVNEELKQANEKLELLSQRDGLTHIFNRSMFDKSMKLEWSSCRKNRLPLSLIMVDIDFFKSLNDSFGHQIGDHCLQQVADVLVFCANRSRDVVSRYGGDEFAVILPQTDQDGAMTIANKLRENVSKLVISGIDSQACQSITISIGVCCVVPSENSSSEDLIKNADQALYEAKKIRNSIHFQSIDVIDVNVI